MRMKLAAFLAAAFAALFFASPLLAAHPRGSGRSGSTIIAGRD
jgi:hypothetical protein